MKKKHEKIVAANSGSKTLGKVKMGNGIVINGKRLTGNGIKLTQLFPKIYLVNRLSIDVFAFN